jgi:1,2-diacylglycerol 3-beta-galactosyltransferase
MPAVSAPGGRPEAVLFVVDAGGGHRATANALVAGAEGQASGVRLRVVSLQEVLAPLDPARRLFGHGLEDVYNALVRRRRTRFLVPLLRALQLSIAALHGRLVARVAGFLAEAPPAVVVSLLPNFNAVLRDAVARLSPRPPFVVLMTDLADFGPRFWLEEGLDGVVVPTEEAARQALSLGLPQGRIWRTSGLVLHPRFYPRGSAEVRARVRQELGARGEDGLAMLLFGGNGSPEMLGLAAALLSRTEARVVAVCGHDDALYAAMGPLEERYRGRLRRLGFTDRVPELTAASDVLLTKPGPGSLAGAFHQRVPVVVCGDARTIPQERFNVRFVAERGLGLTVGRWGDAPAAVETLLRDGQLLDALRARLGTLAENRALWEALGVIDSLARATPAVSLSA